MYNPCFECLNRYGKQYTEECDNTCEYAHALSKLKPYGGVDEVIKCMKGDAIPVALLYEDKIDWTYHIVCWAKKELENEAKRT
jgi:hypothetical protein